MKPSSNRSSVHLRWRELFGLALTLVGVLSLILYFLRVIG